MAPLPLLAPLDTATERPQRIITPLMLLGKRLKGVRGSFPGQDSGHGPLDISAVEMNLYLVFSWGLFRVSTRSLVFLYLHNGSE